MHRIALVIPTLDRSGAEKQLTLLATHLPREEFEVQVVALTRGGPYAKDLSAAGIPVTVLQKRLRFDLVAAWRLRSLLQRLQPDVVHTWLFAANAYVRLVLPRRTLPPPASGRSPPPQADPQASHLAAPPPALRPRMVVSERCVDAWKSGWQLWLDRRLIHRTDRLIANSRAVAEFYQQLGYPAERVTVIPNAVVPPPPPALPREAWLKQWGWSPETKLILWAGRLARQKRVQDILWGCQLLRQADPRTRLAIVGDGPERDRLFEYARQIEVADYVRFLGPRDDAASLLHYADVFWLASDFEGMSNSLMEAMACGKPVVVSDIPPNRELVTHEREGYVVPIGDGVALAQFTRKLFDDPSLAVRLGSAGRRRMAEEFPLDRMVQAHADLYRSLLSPSPPVL